MGGRVGGWECGSVGSRACGAVRSGWNVAQKSMKVEGLLSARAGDPVPKAGCGVREPGEESQDASGAHGGAVLDVSGGVGESVVFVTFGW